MSLKNGVSLLLFLSLFWAAFLPASVYGEEEYRITRSELERILQISGNLEEASKKLAGTRENLESASKTIKDWSMIFYPQLTELGRSMMLSIERAGNLEESAANSRETVKNLEESILRYSNDLSRMKKSRNFWRTLAIAALVLGAGGIAAAVLF